MQHIQNYASKSFSKVVPLQPVSDATGEGIIIDLRDTNEAIMFCNYVIVEAGVTNADGYFHVEPITNSYSFRAVATSGTSPGQVLAGSGTPGSCGTCNTPAVL
jgi:hypothetical protein